MGVKSVLFLLLLVVATSYAQTKCCFPNQFEISMGQDSGLSQAGKASAVFSNAYVAFDYTNKRTGVLANMTQDGQFIFLQEILDYNKGVQYIIQPMTQTCQKIPLSGPMDHCVPANATYFNTIYLGNKKLTIDNFLLSVPGAQATFAVTKGDCIPSSQLAFGESGGVSFLTVVGYYNYVSGIKNPSTYFTVPSYCPKSASNEPKMYDMRRFKLFA